MILLVKVAWSMRGALLALLSFFDMVSSWIESLGISMHNIAEFCINIGTSIMQWMF